MLGKIHFVSAGAGSGKTYRLTQILHEQLASGTVRPSGVVATTFTKKAATELRERVRAHLLDQGDYHLAHAMGQARIGTVNSVCGALLTRFAFEAGMPTELLVLEEGQASVLIKQAIDAVLDGPAVANLIQVTKRLSIENWQGELQALVNQARANDISPANLSTFAAENAADLLSHFPAPIKRDLSSELLKAIAAAMPALKAQAEAGGKKNTREYVELLAAVERGVQSGHAPWSDWVKLSKAAPEAGLKLQVEPINELAARVDAHPSLHTDISNYLEQIFALCGEVLEFYAESKRELGVLDFTDQEHLLLKVLDNETVAEVLKAELDLLLVDEFQDTSPIQLALFLKLAQFAKSIYWVGDIKQAIYGFRGSDTELMKAILEALPELGGEKEILASSWRSRAPLVKLVNSVFGHAFGHTLPPKEIELQAERTDGLTAQTFSNWLLVGKNKTEEVASLACGIQQLVDSGYEVFDKQEKTSRPVRVGDIAVLPRLNSDVVETASGLRALGIPCATSQPGLLATPEATLALACLRRLNDAADTIATAEILSLADCQDPEVWVTNRLKHLAAGGSPATWQEEAHEGQSAHPLLARLAAMRATRLALAPREALQSVITQCNLSQLVVQWKQDASVARVRIANLEALLALSAQYEDSCRNAKQAATISGLILWLGEQAANAQDVLAEPAIDAVKVMTHHAAKGLEWPVVILMGLASEVKDRLWSISAKSRTNIDAQAPLKDRFIRYWPWPFGLQRKVTVADQIATTPTATAFREAAVEEAKRLLYVSMTRARDLLVLARSQRKPQGEWLDTLDTPWLRPDVESEYITTPDGDKIATFTWELDPVESTPSAAPATSPLFWFSTPAKHSPKLPLAFNPSAASPMEIIVAEQAMIGERIPLPSEADMTTVGTALHACIATAFTNRTSPLSPQEVDAILSRMGVEGVASNTVIRQIEAFKSWIQQRWGTVKAYAEYPVQSLMKNDQVLQGRIDLLLEVAAGWVLIDHKSNPFGPQKWNELAEEHSGQLSAYARAIEKTTEKPVLESWLFFPVSGGAVSLQFVRGHIQVLEK